jgi:hypothetical protein
MKVAKSGGLFNDRFNIRLGGFTNCGLLSPSPIPFQKCPILKSRSVARIEVESGVIILSRCWKTVALAVAIAEVIQNNLILAPSGESTAIAVDSFTMFSQ